MLARSHDLSLPDRQLVVALRHQRVGASRSLKGLDDAGYVYQIQTFIIIYD